MSDHSRPKFNFGSQGQWTLGLLVAVAGLVLSAVFGTNLVFSRRHTAIFAQQELDRLGFSQVEILIGYPVGYRIGIPSWPLADRFDFLAQEYGRTVRGYLICYRQLWDIHDSRCQAFLTYPKGDL